MTPIKFIIFFIYISFFVLSSNGGTALAGHEYTLSGKTMGTFYSVKFISVKKQSKPLWKARVDKRLKDINKRLSMYDPKSELSLFNGQNTGITINLSSDFYANLLTAKRLYELTKGSWDGTIKPLVDLWGFGTKKRISRMPEKDKIALALSHTGFHHIVFDGQTVVKTRSITLDLGSIAKGYGVDALAKLFTSSGIRDVLVEIGGELAGFGTNKKGNPWSVGIRQPAKQFSNQQLYKVVQLNNTAIATSGNYRNFFELNNKTFSHIIDPKTGFPVDNQVVSVSVISKDCIFADGLATALMVMDLQKSLDLVNRLADTECLIIQKKAVKFISHMSDNFDRFIKK